MTFLIIAWLGVGVLGFIGMTIATIIRKQYSYAVAYALAIAYVIFGAMKVSGAF
jgi:Tfp pilus assembly protein PilV